jgi:hypothetical protein
MGGMPKKISQTPPEGLFANKKSFLFAKRPLRHPARPSGGMCHVPLAQRAESSYFLILLFFFLFSVQILILHTILNSYLFQIQDLFTILFCIHIKF